MFFKKLLKDLMMTFNPRVVEMIEYKLLKRLSSILLDLKSKTQNSLCLILQSYTINLDKKWGLRQYVILTECLREWAEYLPKNIAYDFKTFILVYQQLKTKIPFFQKYYYYYSNLDQLDQKDTIFYQDPQYMKLTKEPQIDQKKAQDQNLLAFEDLKLKRKLLMHQIFKNRVVIEEIQIKKNEYQNTVLDNFNVLENFIKNGDQKFQNEKRYILKEIELANHLIKYFDQYFQEKQIQSKDLQKLRNTICTILKKIYKKVPQHYQNYLQQSSKIFMSRKSLDTYKELKSRSHSQISKISISKLNQNSKKKKVFNLQDQNKLQKKNEPQEKAQFEYNLNFEEQPQNKTFQMQLKKKPTMSFEKKVNKNNLSKSNILLDFNKCRSQSQKQTFLQKKNIVIPKNSQIQTSQLLSDSRQQLNVEKESQILNKGSMLRSSIHNSINQLQDKKQKLQQEIEQLEKKQRSLSQVKNSKLFDSFSVKKSLNKSQKENKFLSRVNEGKDTKKKINSI